MAYIKITPEFWDFIEKYLPNYYNRDDIARQSDLQMYIDGHESPVANELTIDEAEDELNTLLLNIFQEAIDAYSKGFGSDCPECSIHTSDFCPSCGKKRANEVKLQNPWRCAECGSLSIQLRAWVDANTDKVYSKDASEEEDFWCDYCGQHSRQLQEEELIKEIDEWWEGTDDETKRIVTDVKYCSSDMNPDADRLFDEACKKFWGALSNEQKIEYWKHYTYNSEGTNGEEI